MTVREDDSRLRQVGFCCLKGYGILHYARKYEVSIGRKSKSTVLDVAIGDNMNISRQHATILYNFDKKAWELTVLGKNGVTVQNTLYTPSSPPLTLQSGDLLQLGDRAFFFLLEKGSRLRLRTAKHNRGTHKTMLPSGSQQAITSTVTSIRPPPSLVPFALQGPVQVRSQADQSRPQHSQPPVLYGQMGSGIPFPNPTGPGQQFSQPSQVPESTGNRLLQQSTSPLLQQLMAASSTAMTPAAPIQVHTSEPNMVSLSPHSWQRVEGEHQGQATGGIPVAADAQPPPNFPYPEGFPAQLMQGLHQHQHLAQLAKQQIGVISPEGQSQISPNHLEASGQSTANKGE